MKTKIALLALGLVAIAPLAATVAAVAHGIPQPAFGGQVAEAGDVHVEFAVRDGGVRAWVRDHMDKPVTVAGGKATLLVAGKKVDVPLQVSGDVLTADAPVSAGDKVAAVLSLTVDGKPLSVRFAQEAVTTPALSPQAQAGAALFANACAACHGPALRGSDAGPPLLHAYYAPGNGHGDDVVLSAIAKGAKSHHWKFGDMPKPQGVQPGREADILAYIRAMQAANGIAAGAGAMDMHMGHH